MPRRTNLTSVVIAISLGTLSNGRADQSELITRINEAWRVKDASIRSFEATWIQQTTQLAGSKGQTQGNTPIPEKDKSFPISFRLVCDGRKVRLEREGIDFDGDTRSYLEKKFIRVFDGTERREVFNSVKYGAHPAGFVDDREIFETTDWRIHGLVCALRPASAKLMGAVSLSGAEIKPQPAVIGGVDCHVFSVPRDVNVTDIVYIADAPDYRVIRREEIVRGTCWRDLTIEYENNSGWGNVCSGWTIVNRNRIGGIEQIAVVSKLALRIGDEIDDGLFEFQFAPGTVVSHERTNSLAVVRSNGTLRSVTPGEHVAGIPWSKLMETDPPQETLELGRSTGSLSHLFVFATIIVGFAVAAYLYLRLKKR